MALINGPEHAAEAGSIIFDYGITHSSYVHYTKETNPFVALVERVYFGGRPAANLQSFQQYSDWRRDLTQYMRWNGGTQWDAQITVGSSDWDNCGSPGSLCWWNLNNTADLEDSAMVRQRLAYKITFWAGGDGLGDFWGTTEWYGGLNEHYLE